LAWVFLFPIFFLRPAGALRFLDIQPVASPLANFLCPFRAKVHTNKKLVIPAIIKDWDIPSE
jgi:hypothetical protein